jgi:hypothetical protein
MVAPGHLQEPRNGRGMLIACMCVYNYGHGHDKPMVRTTPTPDVMDDVTILLPQPQVAVLRQGDGREPPSKTWMS